MWYVQRQRDWIQSVENQWSQRSKNPHNHESFLIRGVADSWIYEHKMWQRLPDSTNEREVEPT